MEKGVLLSLIDYSQARNHFSLFLLWIKVSILGNAINIYKVGSKVKGKNYKEIIAENNHCSFARGMHARVA